MRQRWTPSASTDTGQAVRSRSAGRARGGGQRDRETAMIRGYVNRGDRLQAVETALDRDDAFVWIDLISPTQDEEADIEARPRIDLPSREDMEATQIPPPPH